MQVCVPSFWGRVPLVFSTQAVPLDELKKHIPKLGLYQAYKALYPNLKDAAVIKEIVKILVAQNKETPIGIRLLNTAIHMYFMRDI